MNVPFQIFGTYKWINSAGNLDAELVDPFVTIRCGTIGTDEAVMDVCVGDDDDCIAFLIESDDPPTSRDNAAVVVWVTNWLETNRKI